MMLVKKNVSLLWGLLLLCALLAILALPAHAATVGNVSYIYYNDTPYQVHAGYINSAVEVGSDTTEWKENDCGGWYAVRGDVTINSRVTVSGDIKLILCDGATLTATKGINVDGENNTNSLIIFGQSAGTGALYAGCSFQNGSVTASCDDYNAGIGGATTIGTHLGAGGSVTVHGGRVTACGGQGAAGIGGGFGASQTGTVTVFDGTVTAQGGEQGAGIGGGNKSSGTGDGGNVIIYGGTVKATGGSKSYSGAGAGIGGGDDGNGGSVTVYGGTVEATGGGDSLGFSGAGIGGGCNGHGGNFAVYGGTVKAVGGTGVRGVGSGMNASSHGAVTIGQTVRATGEANDNVRTFVEQIPYVYYTWDSSTKTLTAHTDGSYPGFTRVGITTTNWSGDVNGGWYVVKENVEIDSRINVSGDVKLILCDGATLTVPKGITVGSGKSLTIYGQSGGTGKLYAGCQPNGNDVTVTCAEGAAGIGGGIGQSGGDITVQGGQVTAMGGAKVVLTITKHGGAGIGGGAAATYEGAAGAGGSFVMYGGTVNAAGGGDSPGNLGGAGIGSGACTDKGTGASGGRIVIHGGTVNAAGGPSASVTNNAGGAGLGGGACGDVDSVEITGGTVNATALYGAGIGSGGAGSLSGTVTIIGGSVKASANYGVGIGGYNEVSGSITINGGTVEATGGEYNAKGIGAIIGSVGTLALGPNVNACGGESSASIADIRAGITVSARPAYMKFEEFIPYVYYVWDDENKTLTQRTGRDCTAYTPVETTTSAWSGTDNGGWYVVKENVTITDRVTVSGDVKLLLCDGATLTVPGGITVEGNNSLTVYGQSAGTGRLYASCRLNGNAVEPTYGIGAAGSASVGIGGAGIGGTVGKDAGSITVHGGQVTAMGSISYGSDQGCGAAGIGGGGGTKISGDFVTGSGGSFTIYGGTVEATGGYSDDDDYYYGGAGIGGGGTNVAAKPASGGSITVYGGTVKAHGTGAESRLSGAGLGGGAYGDVVSIVINGGTVIADATGAPAIGSGESHDLSGNITINGGTVTATSTKAVGIGGDHHVNGSITINGGTVTATGSTKGVGGGLNYSDGTLALGPNVNAYGGESSASIADIRAGSTVSSRPKYMKFEEFIPYVYYTEVSGAATLHKDGKCLLSESTQVTEQTKDWTGGWYVVRGDVTINNDRVSVTGDVKLILCDGATLTVPGGITVSKDGNTVNSLSIYGQSAGTGALYAGCKLEYGEVVSTCSQYSAGIGGDITGTGGTVTVHGGRVTAYGGTNGGAGIGGAYTGAGGSFTIYGGTVKATGGSDQISDYAGAGIGGGNQGKGGSFTMYGGAVEATGGAKGAGIGGGKQGNGSTVSIFGGTVKAVGGTGAKGVGIGAGGQSNGTVTLGPAMCAYGSAYDGDYTDIRDGDTVSERYRYMKFVERIPYRYYEVDETGAATLHTDGARELTDLTQVTAATTAWSKDTTGGWYVVIGDVTVPDRISVSGDVYLILCDGAKLEAKAGITVNDGTTTNSLSIYAQSDGADMGKLYAGCWLDGNTVTTSCGDNNAGIGGRGMGDDGGDVTIHGGIVEARGGSYGAGIGGGYLGRGCGEGDPVAGPRGGVTVYAGTVIAYGGTDATGIGGGCDGKGGRARIFGGSVEAHGNGSGTGGTPIPGIGKGSVATNQGILWLAEGMAAFDTESGYSLLKYGGDVSDRSQNMLVCPAIPYQYYTEENGVATRKDGVYPATECTEVTDQTAWSASTTGGWYVVKSNQTINDRITVTGSVHLILCDGATLTAKEGITVSSGNSLSIYAQSDGDNMGKLYAGCWVDNGTVTTSCTLGAGIGGGMLGAGGTVNIHGGAVEARGGSQAAGIGGDMLGAGGSVTVYAGSVTAYGDNYSAGIGGGMNSGGGSVKIYGGTVTAEGGSSAAGIGGYVSDGTLTLGAGVILKGGANDYSTFIARGAAENVTERYSHMQAHAHHFTAAYSASGDTITATCDVADCPCGGAPTMKIKAPAHTTYNDGNSPAATLEDAEGIHSTETVSYYTADENGAKVASLSAAPETPGRYRAEITVGGKTAYVVYTISAAAQTASADSYTVIYDGEEHGITVTTSVTDATVRYRTAASGDYTLTECPKFTDVGKHTVYYQVTKDHYNACEGSATVTITEAPVTVTVTGHHNAATYTGEELYVLGYDVEISNPLYTEADFTFSGKAEARRTETGTSYMGLEETQFTNVNGNFDVSFYVTDGWQMVAGVDEVIVTVTGRHGSAPYDGAAHTVSGYELEFSNPLYTEADFSFNGTAKAARTETGTTQMGLSAAQFANLNTNFNSVIFVVTDGYQTVVPINATVTVTGHSAQAVYDGAAHAVSGYELEFSTPLYTEADFSFSGTAEAARTEAGTTFMGLTSAQFANTNPNFNSVTFLVADGYVSVDQAEQDTPAARFDATGPDCGVLSALEPGAGYSLSGSALGRSIDVTADADGVYTVADDVAAGELVIVRRGDASHTPSAPQTIRITKAATPALVATQPAVFGEKGSIPTTAEHEVSTDGTTWTACTGALTGLEAGVYRVRVRAAGTVLASEPQTVAIGQGSTYAVTVKGGTVSGGGVYFAEGETVTVVADAAPEGQEFDRWTGDVEFADATAGTTSFTMPAGAVTVTATFRESSRFIPSYSAAPARTTYAPRVSAGDHGKVSVSPENPQEGDTVTLTVTPEEGYRLARLTVTDAEGKPVELTKQADGSYQFTQPAGAVTIEAAFRPALQVTPITEAELLARFDDLAADDWFLEVVRYCVERGIMEGMGDGSFGASLPISRTMIAQILWNLEGRTEPEGPAPFDDVPEDAWYAKAVAWAYEAGITKGTGESFGSDEDVTREQLAVMLYNYAVYMGCDVADEGELDAFPDAGAVSGWAQKAMRWAVGAGIINGTVDETGTVILDAQGSATRAQGAAMIQRFCKQFLE